MKKIRVAVIGAGNMGKNHIRNYLKIDQVDLVAIADPINSIDELVNLHGIRFYKDYNDMLESESIDAVSIVVPTPLHYKIAKQTLGSGIHTLLEKPIASTIAEAEKLLHLAQNKKVIFTIGHIERYNPIVKNLYTLIHDGKLGKVSSIVCRRVGGFPATQPATDVVLDLAIHDIDIMRFLVGHKPNVLAVHGSRTFHSSEVDSAEILLSFNGTSGFIQTNWVTPTKIRAIAITGSNGYVEANYITQEVVFYEHMASKQSKNFREFVKILGEPKKHLVNNDLQEPLHNELDQFIKAIQGGDPSSLVSPQEATEALETALKISTGLQKG